MKKILSVVLALALLLALAACGSASTPAAKETIKVGASSTPHAVS